MTNYQDVFDLIEKNWLGLNEEVEALSSDIGRSPPKIIAVSKTRNLEEIEIAYDIGIRDFGENYPQELEQKAKRFQGAKWHFIGHLQSGNAKRIIPYCNVLHTLDSLKLAKKLSNLSYRLDVLIQIKMGTEISKSGILWDTDIVKEFIKQIKEVGLKVVGLMGIGSLSWDRNKTLIEYSNLAALNTELGFSELSLGMSDDYREAIQAGSTMIRVGTKIFGKRLYQPTL